MSRDYAIEALDRLIELAKESEHIRVSVWSIDQPHPVRLARIIGDVLLFAGITVDLSCLNEARKV